MNDVFQHMLANPSKAKAELSLHDYTRQAWHVLHPGTPFTDGWAVGAIAEHLQAITEGDVARLLINVPPGCTKSMLTNVMWPSWEWGPRGMLHHQFISTSYDKSLPIRDQGYCRDLIDSEWYQQRWPMQWKRGDAGKENYWNSGYGFRKAASVGSGLTGWRAHRFIIDDPHSVKLAESDVERAGARFWFSETTPSRFNDPRRPIYVVIMQRLHSHDISGSIIEGLLEEQGWTHLCLPMEYEPKYRTYTSVPPVDEAVLPERVRRVKDEGDVLHRYEPDEDGELLYPQDPRTEEGELLWPERYDEQAVRDLKVQMTLDGGSYAVACQLQQRPVPREGGMFKVDRLKFVDEPIEGRVVRGYDLAASTQKASSWTAGAKLILGWDGQLCIADVDRFRGETDEVRRRIRTTAEADGYECAISVPQDPGQAGKAQVAQYAKDLHGFDVHFSLESGDKDSRAEPFSAQVNAGNVCVVRGPWVALLLAELGLFPGSNFKDQVDALSRAYARLLQDVQDPISLFGPKLIIGD